MLISTNKSTMSAVFIFSATDLFSAVKTFGLSNRSFRTIIPPPLGGARMAAKIMSFFRKTPTEGKYFLTLFAGDLNLLRFIVAFHRTKSATGARGAPILFSALRTFFHSRVVGSNVKQNIYAWVFRVFNQLCGKFSDLAVVVPYDAIGGIKNGLYHIVNIYTLIIGSIKYYSHPKCIIAIKVRFFLFQLELPFKKCLVIFSAFRSICMSTFSIKFWSTFGQRFSVDMNGKYDGFLWQSIWPF